MDGKEEMGAEMDGKEVVGLGMEEVEMEKGAREVQKGEEKVFKDGATSVGSSGIG